MFQRFYVVMYLNVYANLDIDVFIYIDICTYEYMFIFIYLCIRIGMGPVLMGPNNERIKQISRGSGCVVTLKHDSEGIDIVLY
jgi:hypothetical protein